MTVTQLARGLEKKARENLSAKQPNRAEVSIMQRDGEGLQEQQNMEQKHDYVRTIHLFMGSRQETTPPSLCSKAGLCEAAHIPLLISLGYSTK